MTEVVRQGVRERERDRERWGQTDRQSQKANKDRVIGRKKGESIAVSTMNPRSYSIQSSSKQEPASKEIVLAN